MVRELGRGEGIVELVAGEAKLGEREAPRAAERGVIHGPTAGDGLLPPLMVRNVNVGEGQER